MRIAILGTRGIPNHYGGFEQFAEYLSPALVRDGHEVYVYNSHDHPYKKDKWNDVNIIHCFDPEYRIGTAGQFIYDLNCILDSRKREYDLILQLGYTSSSVFNFLISKNTVIVTNMDGLEWKRSKFGKMTRRFLKYAEGLAVKRSDHLIADSIGIKDYLKATYGVDSEYIPYGAHAFSSPDIQYLSAYDLKAFEYDMLIARLEPENNIDVILEGAKDQPTRFLVIGNNKTKYGQYLTGKYAAYRHIEFLGGIYDMNIINNLRFHSRLYFHGHSVGGTNPSLLEAMASQALIVAHQNIFNRSILGEDAFYFTDPAEVGELRATVKKENEQEKVNANFHKIKTLYSWEKIIGSYEKFLTGLSKK